MLSGVLAGIGLVAFVDETVFHQLLHWHHFYDKSTLEAGLVSDGLFHAFGFFAIVAGLFLFADLRRRQRLRWPRWVGGLLVGAGGVPALRRAGPAQGARAAPDPLPGRPRPVRRDAGTSSP